MMEDPELNTRRLSCIDYPATMTWNDFWQALCDKACDGENQEDMHVTEKACEYATRVVNETREMSETILKHFICPSDLNEYLRDGLCDKDGGYFIENGAVFVNPLHVRSERVNTMLVISYKTFKNIHHHIHQICMHSFIHSLELRSCEQL